MTSITSLGASKSNNSNSQLVQKHEHLFTKTDHLTVEFSQDIYRKMRDRTISRDGYASFSKPNKFYWVFNGKRGVEKFYYDGSTLSHYQSQINTVTHYSSKSSFKQELQEIVDLVLNTKKLFDRYHVQEMNAAKESTQLVLIPQKDNNTDITKITVQISDRIKMVENVKIEYADGNYTNFRFKSPRTTPNNPNIFTFSQPDGKSAQEKHVR